MDCKQKFLLAFIILLAVFFRFYQIFSLPGGLFPDEAANGLDINLMQQSQLQPFYERGNGREALFFYMEWASVEAFGKGPWQHHIVSALIGLLSVLMCFLVARKIFQIGVASDDVEKQNRATNIALLSAFLMAVSTWHIVLSRTAFRAIQIPLFSSLTIYFLIAAYQAASQKARWWFAFLTGASFAGGFYTYIAFRIMAPLLFGLLLWPLLGQIKYRQFWKTAWSYKWLAVSFLLAFFIVFYPLGKYFYQHPGSFVGRAGQVSVFNPGLYTVDGIQLSGKPPLGVVLPAIAEVAKVQILGFFTRGDLNWRSNISGFPFLSPLFSPFFGIGLLAITWLSVVYFFSPAKRARYWKYFLLSAWFWGMLLPVVTTAEGIPHGLRSIGVIPAVFIISAWALYEFARVVIKVHRKLWAWTEAHYKDPEWMRKNRFVPLGMRIVNFGLRLTAVCFLLALIFQSYFLYFVYAANDPSNFYYFRSDLTIVSNYLIQRCDKSRTYLVLDKFSVQTTDYLTSDPKGNFSDKCSVPYIQVDPENAWQLKGLKSGDEVVFTQSSIFDTKKFKQYHPEVSLRLEYRNKFQQTVMAVYGINN